MKSYRCSVWLDPLDVECFQELVFGVMMGRSIIIKEKLVAVASVKSVLVAPDTFSSRIMSIFSVAPSAKATFYICVSRARECCFVCTK